MGMGAMNGHKNPRSLITEQEAKAAFRNTHQWLHPNKCCLSITYCSTLQGVKGSKATFPGTSRVASSVPLSTSAHRRCQRRAGRGGTQLPRGVITGACAPITAPKGPLTSLGCLLLYCPKNTWNKSSLGFLVRPTCLPGADPRKHSGHCKELRAAGQGRRLEVSGVRSPWLLQVLV